MSIKINIHKYLFIFILFSIFMSVIVPLIIFYSHSVVGKNYSHQYKLGFICSIYDIAAAIEDHKLDYKITHPNDLKKSIKNEIKTCHITTDGIRLSIIHHLKDNKYIDKTTNNQNIEINKIIEENLFQNILETIENQKEILSLFVKWQDSKLNKIEDKKINSFLKTQDFETELLQKISDYLEIKDA